MSIQRLGKNPCFFERLKNKFCKRLLFVGIISYFYTLFTKENPIYASYLIYKQDCPRTMAQLSWNPMRNYFRSRSRVGIKVEDHSKLLHHSISLQCGDKFILNGL